MPAKFVRDIVRTRVTGKHWRSSPEQRNREGRAREMICLTTRFARVRSESAAVLAFPIFFSKSAVIANGMRPGCIFVCRVSSIARRKYIKLKLTDHCIALFFVQTGVQHKLCVGIFNAVHFYGRVSFA